MASICPVTIALHTSYNRAQRTATVSVKKVKATSRYFAAKSVLRRISRATKQFVSHGRNQNEIFSRRVRAFSPQTGAEVKRKELISRIAGIVLAGSRRAIAA